MSYHAATINEAYREFAELQVQRHLRLREGKDESPEIEALEDQLSALWEQLDENQQRELNGMGSDLNWLRRFGEPPPLGRTKDHIQPADLKQLEAAQSARDWQAMLHDLRACMPAVPSDVAAYTRATCYHHLGFPKLAEEFADLAIVLSGEQSSVAASAMSALTRVAPGMAIQRAIQVISQPKKYPPVIVAQSLAYLMDTRGGRMKEFGVNTLVEIILDAWERLEMSPVDPKTQALFYQLAGDELRVFGRNPEARALYEKGLQLAPDNAEMLSGLGLLLYEQDQKRAVELLQKALQIKPMHFRPYLHLAHYHLVRDDYVAAFNLAQDALALARENEAKAAALDMMAVSADEMGVDAEVVREMFNRAVDFAAHAPWRDRVIHNRSVYLSKLAGKPIEQNMDVRLDALEMETKEATFRRLFGEPVFAR